MSTTRIGKNATMRFFSLKIYRADYSVHMNKKIIALLSMSLLLTACGGNKEAEKPKVEVPTRIETGSLGESNTNLTTDLNSIVEQAYQDAANSASGAAAGTGAMSATGTANTP